MFFRSGVGWGEAGCYRSYTCAYVVDVTSLAFARAPDATLEHGVVWVGMLAFMYAYVQLTLRYKIRHLRTRLTLRLNMGWRGVGC